MDHHSNFPFLDVSFGRLAELSDQDDVTDPRLYYQGMSVQALDTPSTLYFSQSNAGQNNAHSINPLNEFRAASLAQANPDGFDKSDIPDIPESTLNEYVPWSSDNKSVGDTLLSIPSSYHCDQPSFLGNEPDMREPTPANRFNPDHHLTNLPVDLANPQDSRPVAVVDQLNLQQATSDNPTNSTEIIDDNSSQVKRNKERKRERQREYRKNPAYLARERERRRKRYQEDPDYAETYKKRARERYQNNPVYTESRRVYVNIYRRMKDKIGKEEASKLASVARAQYLQSVNSLENRDDLPQTSNSAETTQNSNHNLNALPILPSQTNQMVCNRRVRK